MTHVFRMLRRALPVTIMVILVSCGPAAASDLGCSGALPTGATDMSWEVQEVLRLTNAHRASVGAPPVALDPTLQRAAQWKARDMAARDYYTHDDPPMSPGGSARTPSQRAEECGHLYGAYTSENIAWWYADAAAAFAAWLDSPGHRNNIENPAHRYIGIGAARGFVPDANNRFGYPADHPVSVKPMRRWVQLFNARADPDAEPFQRPSEPIGQRITLPWTAEFSAGTFTPDLASNDPWNASSLDIVDIHDNPDEFIYNGWINPEGRALVFNVWASLFSHVRTPLAIPVEYRTRNVMGEPSSTTAEVTFVLQPKPAPPCTPPVIRAGMTLGGAKQAITKANCTVGTITGSRSRARTGTAVKLSHVRGTVHVIMSGCVVPQLTAGTTIAKAKLAITRAGCGIGTVSKIKHSVVTAGRIVRSRLARGHGAVVRYGSTINLVVSRGKR